MSYEHKATPIFEQDQTQLVQYSTVALPELRKLIAQVYPTNVTPDVAGTLNQIYGKNPERPAAAFSADSTGKIGVFGSFRSNQTTILLGLTNKEGINNPLYQLNQNIDSNTAIYIQGDNMGNILGINRSVGNGENITGNIFIEQNLNTNNTYVRGVVGKSF
jgi:hypothetical protein